MALGAEFIGINNRNLRTFETALETSINLAVSMPSGTLLVSESGIVSHEHVLKLDQEAGIGTFLVGESLMRQDDVTAATRALLTHAIIIAGAEKSDALAVAQIAGIMAAKKTSELIQLCHPIILTKVSITIAEHDEDVIVVMATAETTGQTGVEMEVLVGVSTAALTLYGMTKTIDRGMVVIDICLMEKSVGKSGDFVWL
ncbi:MAG: cyclic pyranopterin monophosphate synthase MoaC [Candidatus Devosia symbiotica]|nr:cyclic pyranopterin monophosphate synthase MoaC [Candidatus Devosia symbiotica]